MTTAQTQDPRGAGTGREANATRDREYNQTVPGAAPVHTVGGSTAYPVGDAAKGRIDPDKPDAPIPMRDRRAYLIEQANLNEAANDELNAMQVQQNIRVQEMLEERENADPDTVRAESMETAVMTLKSQDPDVRRGEAKSKVAAKVPTKDDPKRQ
jgi:Fe-S-cluster formation regulator IscX/YfhJ